MNDDPTVTISITPRVCQIVREALVPRAHLVAYHLPLSATRWGPEAQADAEAISILASIVGALDDATIATAMAIVTSGPCTCK